MQVCRKGWTARRSSYTVRSLDRHAASKAGSSREANREQLSQEGGRKGWTAIKRSLTANRRHWTENRRSWAGSRRSWTANKRSWTANRRSWTANRRSWTANR